MAFYPHAACGSNAPPQSAALAKTVPLATAPGPNTESSPFRCAECLGAGAGIERLIPAALKELGQG